MSSRPSSFAGLILFILNLPGGHQVSGKVEMEIGVDEEGNVTKVDVLNGHPLLTEAAVNAVKQWKYSPTLLNGEPVPINARAVVVFKLTIRV